MDPTNKFWWFAGLSILLTVAIVSGIAVFFWQQLTPGEHVLLLAILKKHFIYLFIVIVLMLAMVGFALDGIFHTYILPLDRLHEEVELIYTVNPAHRIRREGSKLINLLIDAINDGAERYHDTGARVQSLIREAMDKLEVEKNILAVIMSELPEGVLICNTEGQILFYNRQARRFLSESAEAQAPASDAGNPDPSAFIGLGRSVFEFVDRHLISYALEELAEKLDHQAAGVASYFVVVARDGRHLRTEMVPVLNPDRQFTGYILIFSDITTQLETDWRADLLLQSLTGGVRTSLAGVRAASETILEFPDMAADQLRDFVRLIHREALAIGRTLHQHSPDRLERPRSQWPRIDTRAGSLLDKITVKARHLLGLRLVPEAYDTELRLNIDSYAFSLAVLFLMRMARESVGLEEIHCRLHRTDGYVNLDLTWPGAPIKLEGLRRWEEKVLSLADEGLPLTLGEVLRYHEAEIWPRPVSRTDALSGIRLTLPAVAGPAAADRGFAILPASRPEFYDFDLFNQPGQSPELDDRPLTELTFTVFDTETTGLDPRGGDEIISIGAVRIVNGRLLPSDRFEQYVNPRRPLSRASIQIHGIREEMLRNQPSIEEVLPRFHRFAANTILVAHNAAFDMRMLQMKEAATGLRFINPVLDTLLLSAVVHPAHKQHNLTTIARRLGIEIQGRHTAIGDALATGDMFLKLLPLLAKKGIRTLKEARLASQGTYHARLKY
jgi:DNA polymerase-3 subunit epsilon